MNRHDQERQLLYIKTLEFNSEKLVELVRYLLITQLYSALILVILSLILIIKVVS